jgi:sulfotransferase family protein
MPGALHADLPLGGAQVPRPGPDRPAEPGGAASDAPVIVLASPYSGATGLRALLARQPDLACTSATGLLPLCEQAMTTWRNADGRAAGPPSRLAVTATRALAASIITSVLAREGKRRWCEVAAANAPAAETFLRLYPGTRFLCLHRACQGMIRAALDASPWGIADPVFAPFTLAYPGSTPAALTACWVTYTRTVLAFEAAHPQACLRVRFEDLTEAQHQTAGKKITAFLGIADLDTQSASRQSSQLGPASQNSCPEKEFPVDLIPPTLLAQANDLLRQLDYPALAQAETRVSR